MLLSEGDLQLLQMVVESSRYKSASVPSRAYSEPESMAYSLCIKLSNAVYGLG